VKSKSQPKKKKKDDGWEFEAISDKILVNARKSVMAKTVLIQIIPEILLKINTPLKRVTGFEFLFRLDSRLFTIDVAHK
jgi:hypothetical protein